ncbi:hypothetical protein JCM3765_004958 [Sporobolomyces pararoseus]
MPRQIKRSSPPASRRPVTSPKKPSLSLKLLACAISISPFLFARSATELLYPLFSAAPTHSLATSLTLYSTLIGLFLVQRVLIKRTWSWRTYWLVIGMWKILSEGLVRWFGENLLNLGLEKGVFVGRFLLEGVPQLALSNWVKDSIDCKERVKFIPTWLIPSSWLLSLLVKNLNSVPSILAAIPTCYILQLQGVFLIFMALFATHHSLNKVPRSPYRPHPVSRPLSARILLFALAIGLAHSVATSSTHCPTSLRLVPLPKSSSHILASKKSSTGVIVVGEQEIPGPNGAEGYRFRYLRADHSLLGGLWTGVSEMELKRMRSEVTEDEVVKRAESIYSTFILQELIRLVETPEDLPHQTPEQGLVIGLGAGLIARALDQHQVNLTICEIDPVVYQFARKYFAVPEPSEVVLRDAKAWLEEGAGGGKVFDYIVHDVFTGGQVPASLFTVEFWSTLRQRLHHSGILAVNFAGSLSSPASKLVLTTLVDSFPHCRAFEDNPSSGSNSTVGDDTVFKNLVIFCSPSWYSPIRFRAPIPDDFLPYPSPQIRKKVFADYESQEVSLDRFKLVKEDEEEGSSRLFQEKRQWVLTDKNSKKLEKLQLEGTKEHWRAMEKVLPRETWASW